MNIDCRPLVYRDDGQPGYGAEYEARMASFALLGASQVTVKCEGVPSSWAPLIVDLGHEVESVEAVERGGWEFEAVDWLSMYLTATDPRRILELASTCRPELVHALYCADTEWRCPLRAVQAAADTFPVTCGATYQRPEVAAYTDALRAYVPGHSCAVLVPCSVDKPYPSPVHSAVRAVLSDEWAVIVVSGVLGLVPDGLWDVAPRYDAGLPNFHRVEHFVEWYFTRHRYDAVVSYSDFYARSVALAMGRVPDDVRPAFVSVFGGHWRDRYENLVLPEHLAALERAVRTVETEALT